MKLFSNSKKLGYSTKAKIHHPLENGKTSPSKQLFSPNHIDFNRYCIISPSSMNLFKGKDINVLNLKRIKNKRRPPHPGQSEAD